MEVAACAIAARSRNVMNASAKPKAAAQYRLRLGLCCSGLTAGVIVEL